MKENQPKIVSSRIDFLCKQFGMIWFICYKNNCKYSLKYVPDVFPVWLMMETWLEYQRCFRFATRCPWLFPFGDKLVGVAALNVVSSRYNIAEEFT